MAFMSWYSNIIARRAKRRDERQRQECERIQKERDEMAALELQLSAQVNQKNADILRLESKLQSAQAVINADRMRQLMQMNGINREQVLRAQERACERRALIVRSYCTPRCPGNCKGYH